MATYVLPPGAWLSSGLQPPITSRAGLQPGIGGNSRLQPPIAGNSQLQPGIGGNSELQPPIGGGGRPRRFRYEDHSLEQQLSAAAARLTVASPWRGGDSSWIYEADEGAMMVEALGRSSSRLVREMDPRVEGGDNGRVLLQPGLNGDPLWRWGDEPRNLAVQSDLNWRFAVEDCCLWYLSRGTGDGLQVTFCESMDFHGLPTQREDLYTLLDEQADKVLRAAVEREDRLPEILAQAANIMPFFYNLTGLDPQRAPITANLLQMAQQWATPLIMALKNQLGCLRPFQVSSRIVPVIDTPAHGSLPSGHAAIASLVAALLRNLLFDDDLAPSKNGLTHPKVLQIDRLARRIAHNRVVAGVHFPVDSRAGYGLGLQLGAHLVGLASGSGKQPGRYDPLLDLEVDAALKEGSTPAVPGSVSHVSGSVAVSQPLQTIWDAARNELMTLSLRKRINQ